MSRTHNGYFSIEGHFVCSLTVMVSITNRGWNRRDKIQRKVQQSSTVRLQLIKIIIFCSVCYTFHTVPRNMPISWDSAMNRNFINKISAFITMLFMVWLPRWWDPARIAAPVWIDLCRLPKVSSAFVGWAGDVVLGVRTKAQENGIVCAHDYCVLPFSSIINTGFNERMVDILMIASVATVNPELFMIYDFPL